MNQQLSGRQARERAFYDEFATLSGTPEVSFDPVAGPERRPWNSYWHVYGLARTNYESGARDLLDLGCGTGVSAVRFAHLGYRVSGCDIASRNIEIANTLAKKYRCDDRMRLSVQEAEKLDYPDECFDIVVGMNILHHVEIPRSVAETLRVLKQHGVAVFREHVEAPIIDYFRNTRIIRRWMPKDRSMDLHHHITEDERKLNKKDIANIRALCPQVELRRFKVLSRFDRFVRRPGSPRASFIERIDFRLLKVFPFLGMFGDSVVLILKKE